jgi:alkanesulfonate monooxygenase SsuD/methylene tetrahydromethanopterin reductase-like flavin-dependent oxidoreductase (luciferase family)
MAAVTQRLKLLPGVAAIPRYAPHLLARLTVSLDRLSEGRLILGAGSGGIPDEFTRYGEAGEAYIRAEKLDEALELLTCYWSGETFTHQGKYYQALEATQNPPSLQQPRIPVWIGGDSQAAYRRAARWDGWIIGTIDEQMKITLPPEELAKRVAKIRKLRASPEPFEVAIDGTTEPGGKNLLNEYAEAGATWYFEAIFGSRGDVESMLRRIEAGPPSF